MRNLFRLVAASALGAVFAFGALAETRYPPPRPETVAAIQKFDRAQARGIAAALDGHGIAADRVSWIKVIVDNMGKGPPVGYDVMVAVTGRRSLIAVRLDLFGDPVEVYALAGGEPVPPRR